MYKFHQCPLRLAIFCFKHRRSQQQTLKCTHQAKCLKRIFPTIRITMLGSTTHTRNGTHCYICSVTEVAPQASQCVGHDLSKSTMDFDLLGSEGSQGRFGLPPVFRQTESAGPRPRRGPGPAAAATGARASAVHSPARMRHANASCNA